MVVSVWPSLDGTIVGSALFLDIRTDDDQGQAQVFSSDRCGPASAMATGGMGLPVDLSALLLALIHWSAWKENSRTSRCKPLRKRPLTDARMAREGVNHGECTLYLHWLWIELQSRA